MSLPKDAIEIVEYNIDWPSAFVQEKVILENVLAGEQILSIEHVGSTAIPGLAAKPIIDILIAVPSVSTAQDVFVTSLKTLEYEFWSDNPNKDVLFFVKGMPPYGVARTHHIHVVETLSAMRPRLQFRDYLIANADERNAYAKLKRRLAAEHTVDREAYTSAKGAFVSRVLRLCDAG